MSSEPVKTFSIGFNEDIFNELKYARIAAKKYGTDHHEFIVTPDLVDIVDQIVWHFDEPFADSSALPTFIVSKLAREYVTVVLSGDGGDDCLGYTRYAFTRTKTFAIYRYRLGNDQTASSALPHAALGKNFLYNVSLDPIDQYIDLLSHFNLPQRNQLYTDDMLHCLNGGHSSPESVFRQITQKAGSTGGLERLLYLDSKTYLPSDIMTKVDRMTMANSLEARSPLLDQDVIDLAGKIPINLKLKGMKLNALKRLEAPIA